MDPQLATAWTRPATAAENPIAARLRRGLDDYEARWARLPQVAVPLGPTLGEGSRGPRVAALRERLGLAAGARFDARLTETVRAFQRAHGLPPSGRADAATVAALNAGAEHYLKILRANLARAQALPANLGERYILVDAAAGRLQLFDHGEPRLSMKVIVGKPAMPTPMMAGLVRWAVFHPYWNVPEDLVRDTVARKVLAQGLSYIRTENMQVLSDYSDHAVELDPAKVDWRAVAEGRLEVRVRQRPGPGNMMGQVKFTFPNPLGIYLHDTPLRNLFAETQRTASSGCIRLEDAMALAQALLGPETVAAAEARPDEEETVALPEPTPVYVDYFTALPTRDGIEFRPDVYRRDSLAEPQQAAAAARSGA